MCGWLSDARTWASRLKRERRSVSRVNASGRTLIATSRLSRVSCARYTSPMPPAPIRAVISCEPTRVPIVSATLFPGQRLPVEGDRHGFQPRIADDGIEKEAAAVVRDQHLDLTSS